MKKNRTIMGLDTIGILLSCLVIAVSIWVLAGPVRASASRTDTIREDLHTLKEQTGAFETALDLKQTTKQKLAKSLSSLGTLRNEAFLDRDLTIISELARKHNLTFTTVNPLNEVKYPGILEERFQLVGQGAFHGWAAFFEDFEKCSIWADITSIEIRMPSTGGNLKLDKVQSAMPTVSFELGLFSTYRENPETGKAKP